MGAVELVHVGVHVVEPLHVHDVGEALAPVAVHGLGDGPRGIQPARQPLHGGRDQRARARCPARATPRCRSTRRTRAGWLRSRRTSRLELGSALRRWRTSSASRPAPACRAGRRRRAAPAWADCATCGRRSTPIALSRSTRYACSRSGSAEPTPAWSWWLQVPLSSTALAVEEEAAVRDRSGRCGCRTASRSGRRSRRPPRSPW